VRPLLDREADLAALRRAVAAVVGGAGRSVLVVGGPGAGKTRLLDEARTLAERGGLRVLSARGDELEHAHPYGIVRQLFETALLGPERAPWLSGPASAASSVFLPESSVEAAPFATLSGLHWLTANAAADGPLALVVDDLHWSDPPSLHVLHYVLRRSEGLPLLLVLGGRPGEVDRLVDAAPPSASTVLRPAPLSPEAAGNLTQQLLGVRPADGFAAASWRATAGNPLLLVELLRALRAEGITPDDASIDLIDRVGPPALARVVLVRLRRLPAEALAVAQGIALLGTGAATSLVAELAGLEEPAVLRAVALLVDAEVIDAQPPLGFVHPIVRDAVYREVAPDQRDRLHALAAKLLHRRAAAPDQVGAHLLLAAPRGLPWVIDTLRAAAADASQRGAVETAITFLRRAVAERPADANPRLLLRLGLTEAAVDPAAAVAHLGDARRGASDAAGRAWISELIARLLLFTDPAGAIAAARQARAELPADEDVSASAVALEHYAGRFSGVRAAPYPSSEAATSGGRMVLAVRAWDLALSGGTAEECVALAVRALLLDEAGETRQVVGENPLFTAMIASTVLLFADDPRALDHWDAWQADAVRAGRAHALIAGGIWQGWTQLRLGRLAEAEASLRAALEGPRAWGPGTESPPAHALSLLAEVLIERGDLDGARETLDRRPANLSPESEGMLLCRCTELRLRAAHGRHEEVLELADAAGDRLGTVRNPAWAPWRSVRAQALADAGRPEEAFAAVEEELALARSWGTPGPVGRALTVLGTLRDDLDALEEAVVKTRDPFARLEQAAALLALGSAIRRRRRPREARAALREAHEVATACGGTAIARRAKAELAAAGGRPRPASGSGPASLTASERRVAELAAAGRRNRDIARQLHLSPKTVEVHLTSAYRKLGLRTRWELAAALGPPGASDDAPAPEPRQPGTT
jgi:DNA-binding NarL/FixJ family response regulator